MKFQMRLVIVESIVVLLFSSAFTSSGNTVHDVAFEEIGRNGVNILVLTAHTDSVSLWQICQHYKKREGKIVMVSFFDKKPNGPASNYLMSDHWWASYNYNKNTGHEDMSFTGYGRTSWGKPKTTKPHVKLQPKKNPPINFGKPIMAMWSAVKLYYGSGTNKTYVGEIVCFSEDGLIKVRYPSGNFEWKSRQTIINLNGEWYIDKADPALKRMDYISCND